MTFVKDDGLPCPICGCAKNAVTDSRPSKKFGGTIRRRRQCSSCQHRWRTYEISPNAFRSFDINAIRTATERMQKASADLLRIMNGAEGGTP